MTHSHRLLVGALLALASGGCTLVADLDSYVSADELGCDLQMRVDNFTPHLADLVVFQAVTRDTDELSAMAIIDPLVDPDRSFRMPHAVAEGPHSFNFWADVNGDGFVQTSPFAGVDHSWQLEDACNYPSNCPDDEPNCFTHVTPFNNLMDPVEVGNDLTLNVVELPLLTGFIEVHLVERDAAAQLRRVVGLYRKDDPEGATELTISLRGLARAGRPYSVDLLVDLDGDGDIDGASEVFTLTEEDGSVYATPVTVDVTTFDPAGDLPEEGILVSPLPGL